MGLNYYRTVRTTAKGRWLGLKLQEVAEEFGVGSKLVGDPEHIVSHHDIIEYIVHVHEPPVPSLRLPASVLFENHDFLVINKPSGIPVHPTVNYFHNSLTEMLKSEYGTLFPCFRLDRLTSGIVILGKTSEFVSHFHRITRLKTYLARVRTADIGDLKQKTVLTQPIVTFNGKRGYDRFLDAWKNSRPAETLVRIASQTPEFTTLEVEPITGRTHQIRKHLALQGMPIHNDELYNDGGAFKALCEDPTLPNFERVWQFAETRRLAKLTGETCDECGAPIYDRGITTMDLHCGRYAFDEYEFHAPSPF